MSELLDHLASQFDVVLIDCAPLLPVTDAAILARLGGGAVLVVGANTINQHEVQGSLLPEVFPNVPHIGRFING